MGVNLIYNRLQTSKRISENFCVQLSNLFYHLDSSAQVFKVVPEGYYRYFFGLKFKTVNLIGGKRFLAVRSGLTVRTYSKFII